MADAVTWLHSLKGSRDAELPPALPPHGRPSAPRPSRSLYTRRQGPWHQGHLALFTAHCLPLRDSGDRLILLSIMSPTLTYVVARVIFERNAKKSPALPVRKGTGGLAPPPPGRPSGTCTEPQASRKLQVTPLG